MVLRVLVAQVEAPLQRVEVLDGHVAGRAGPQHPLPVLPEGRVAGVGLRFSARLDVQQPAHGRRCIHRQPRIQAVGELAVIRPVRVGVVHRNGSGACGEGVLLLEGEVGQPRIRGQAVLAARDQVEHDLAVVHAAAGHGRRVFRRQQSRCDGLRGEDVDVDARRDDALEHAARHLHGDMVSIRRTVDVADHTIVVLHRAVAEVPLVAQVGPGTRRDAQVHHVAHQDVVIGSHCGQVGPLDEPVEVRLACRGLQLARVVADFDVGSVQPRAVQRLDRHGGRGVAAEHRSPHPQRQLAGRRPAGRVHARNADGAGDRRVEDVGGILRQEHPVHGDLGPVVLPCIAVLQQRVGADGGRVGVAVEQVGAQRIECGLRVAQIRARQQRMFMVGAVARLLVVDLVIDRRLNETASCSEWPGRPSPSPARWRSRSSGSARRPASGSGRPRS